MYKYMYLQYCNSIACDTVHAYATSIPVVSSLLKGINKLLPLPSSTMEEVKGEGNDGVGCGCRARDVIDEVGSPWTNEEEEDGITAGGGDVTTTVTELVDKTIELVVIEMALVALSATVVVMAMLFVVVGTMLVVAATVLDNVSITGVELETTAGGWSIWCTSMDTTIVVSAKGSSASWIKVTLPEKLGVLNTVVTCTNCLTCWMSAHTQREVSSKWITMDRPMIENRPKRGMFGSV